MTKWYAVQQPEVSIATKALEHLQEKKTFWLALGQSEYEKSWTAAAPVVAALGVVKGWQTGLQVPFATWSFI